MKEFFKPGAPRQILLVKPGSNPDNFIMFTRTLIVVFCFGCVTFASRADEPPKYKPIDPETVAAYKKLGVD
jgi:hypothetical protein